MTSDMWSAKSLDPYMAVTAHYVTEKNGRLELRSRLIGFRRVNGVHDGDNLGDIFYGIIKEWGILHKVSVVKLLKFD